MNRCLSIFCLLALGASAQLGAAESPAPSATALPSDPNCGPYPKLYKEIIWAWMQASLVDANSAKIEWEAEPACTDLGKDGQHLYGWLVKFKVNARNRFGAYTGKQSHGALIKDGAVVKALGFGY